MTASVFDGFTQHRLQGADDVEIFAMTGGSGPPVLLLHGYPQTHVCWLKIASRLAKDHTVVLTDLRGYGASGKPPGGLDHAAYSKRAMAADQVRIMQTLGFGRFAVAGHDRGGRVAHRLALDFPDAVTRLAVLDIAPTLTMYEATSRAFAEAYYHWFFLIQPFDLPERLIGADPAHYLHTTLKSWCKTDGAIPDEALAHYTRAFCDPSAIHAACEDYRAAATIDLEHDRAGAAAGHRLTMPLLALWGARGTVGRLFDVLETWREKSTSTVEGHPLDCGHFLPEERPDEVLAALKRFLIATP